MRGNGSTCSCCVLVYAWVMFNLPIVCRYHRFVLKVMEKPIEILEVSEDAKKKTKIIDPLEYQRQKDLEG